MISWGLIDINNKIMELSPRDELIAIEKRIYRENQKVILESIRVEESNFGGYEAAYQRATRKFSSLSSPEEMFDAIFDSQVIYVGDYHTCGQSQRSFLRILKKMIEAGEPVIIGLELLHHKYQVDIDAYLKGKIKEETFLKRVSLKTHWIFDLWGNFKQLFDFAKYHQIQVFGIDAAKAKSTVRQRDQATAEILAQIAADYPEHKLLILIGDLHIAPSHLPKEFQKECRKRRIKKKELILYQNSDPIYWKLAEQNLEDQIEVVRIDDRSFCRMHTPPIICQQSYLNWLENEEGEIDYADPKHSFLTLVHRICEFLKIRVGKAREQVEVYTSGDLGFLSMIQRSKKFSQEEMAIIKYQILSNQSYYIAKMGVVYLGNISINHAAEEATHFIKHLCVGDEKPRDVNDAFYANILHEALGFFGSKIVNHKRKSSSEEDYLKQLKFFKANPKEKIERELEYETACLVVEYKRVEKLGGFLDLSFLYEEDGPLFFSVTHGLGYMLGDRLYYALMQGLLKKIDLRHLFYDRWEGKGRPARVYKRLLEKLSSVKIPKRM